MGFDVIDRPGFDLPLQEGIENELCLRFRVGNGVAICFSAVIYGTGPHDGVDMVAIRDGFGSEASAAQRQHLPRDVAVTAFTKAAATPIAGGKSPGT